MDFSSANVALWNPIIQIGTISILILFANILRRKVVLVQKTLMPTSILAGFILLFLRATGVLTVSLALLETLTYHTLALGFIAMSLKVPEKTSSSNALIGSKSGALIVSTYLVQALTGLIISIVLGYTLMPGLFKASGILLPMAYGQGPGQANNVGSTYETLGMIGGRSFGLSLAAMGFLVACIVGVISLNVFSRQGRLQQVKEKALLSGSVTIDTYQQENEIPISESIDKFSMQCALIIGLYLITYMATNGLCRLLDMISPGLASSVGTLLWGFNFIIGSVMAIICRTILSLLRSKGIMHRQYQNNYLLSRISGLAFDIMIVTGIASINMEDLTGYWLPFILMSVIGAITTYIYLFYMCKKLYPDYVYEGFFSMYGMLTGTISSGILLLREIDPNFETPAANNLVVGSSFGIIFGAPVLLLVSIAAKSDFMTLVAFGLVVIYLSVLLLFLFKAGKQKN